MAQPTPYHERIQLARMKLAESQHTFGKRFGVTAAAVSLWEKGGRQAPYDVLSFVEDIAKNWKVCPTCEGVGWTKNGN